MCAVLATSRRCSVQGFASERHPLPVGAGTFVLAVRGVSADKSLRTTWRPQCNWCTRHRMGMRVGVGGGWEGDFMRTDTPPRNNTDRLQGPQRSGFPHCHQAPASPRLSLPLSESVSCCKLSMHCLSKCTVSPYPWPNWLRLSRWSGCKLLRSKLGSVGSALSTYPSLATMCLYRVWGKAVPAALKRGGGKCSCTAVLQKDRV